MMMRDGSVTGAALLALLAGIGVSADTQAQSLAARRYVNGQGVEILVNRNAPVKHDAAIAAPGHKPMATREGDAGTALEPAPAADGPGAVRGPVSHRVDATVQSQRDVDRWRILTTELLEEDRQLQSKRKAIKTAATRNSLGDEQLRDIAADIERHEENIRALTRELNKLQLNAASGRAPKMMHTVSGPSEAMRLSTFTP